LTALQQLCAEVSAKSGFEFREESGVSDRLIIRPVASADHSQWEGLWADYNSFYGRAGATALPYEITRTTWARFFDAREPIYALVAERGGRLLGLAHYLFHRSTIMVEPTCYLQDLFTAERARGQGVGRALIESVYDRARAAGAHRVYWQTHEANLTAMRLYDQVAERSGFVIYRRQL
jgi:GNAT superfamily N-acetyltransferase